MARDFIQPRSRTGLSNDEEDSLFVQLPWCIILSKKAQHVGDEQETKCNKD